jgi:AraC-like DNA-binding protein
MKLHRTRGIGAQRSAGRPDEDILRESARGSHVMTNSTRQLNDVMPESSGTAGLFRTALAGPGHTLPDAFSNLERVPLVERVTRHLNRDLLGARIVLAADEGKGYWEFTRIRDEAYVVIQSYAYDEPRVELMGGDGLIQFNFRLSGDLTLGVSRQHPLRLTGPSLFIWHQPHGLEVPEWTAPKAHERSVSISVRPEFLVKSFFSSSVEAPKALQTFLSGSTSQVNFLHLPLTPEMFGLATKVVDNPTHGPVSLVYVEAIALALLCEAVTEFGDAGAAVQEHFSPRELRCLNVARALLMRQLAPPPTIRQVARSAGMAETSLTRDFKAAFGETIFDFSLRCRMQHALRMLRSECVPIAQVGEAVGYRHPTSFATAFLRHFGMRPKDVRRPRRL